MKHELYHILSGKSQVRFGTVIQAITSYLSNGTQASTTTEVEKSFKEQETKVLESYITANHLWINNIDFSQYVSEGAEQKVYLKDSEYVLKLNDAFYYSSWRDYLFNLLLHNFFFADTAYELKGFTKDNNVLYAVVQQNYVSVTSVTDLDKVKSFLTANGFYNNRNNDYINKEIGIILEDLHDENVLHKMIFYTSLIPFFI
ncbi:hypothetical protein MG290_00775 [Flavobacterium sp. CBA20B-1]|uniref:putative polyvalent protein kinase domain-containing protein n=1 Tax=unclassified Flavobacterium TaxID=196869 RepID=UPI002224EDFB|nr:MULTISPECIES: hypothetical protein [unclassified Flavobacterium]WCM42236.1 hypothetical protein MG290_00775 [Flavobacterium sp. CBA20B-1]